MNNNIDILQQLSRDDIPKLLGILDEDLPNSTVVYHFLLTQLRWEQNIENMRLRILCPNGDWKQGMVVALVSGLALEDKQYGVLYARKGDEERLAAVLRATSEIPWHHVTHFGGLLERHFEAVRQAATAAGVILPQKQPPISHLLSHINPEPQDEPKLSDEKGVRIGRLEPRHLEEVWSLRPLFPNYYKPVIRACLEYNLSKGVFVTREDGTEILASIILQSEYGGVGMGQTHPDYLRRGFSGVAVVHLISDIFKTGIIPFAWTAVANEKITKFFEKLGIPSVDKCMRMEISPDLSGQQHF